LFLGHQGASKTKKEPINESYESRRPHVFDRRVREGRRKQLQRGFLDGLFWRRRRPHRSGSDLPLSDLFQMVLRLRERERHKDQLSVDRIGGWSSADIGADSRLRSFRWSDER